MGNVRGMDLLDARAFVLETYGPASGERLEAALPGDVREVFWKPIRDLGWYPLQTLEAYLVAARATLDPSAGDFFRREGRFGAARRKGGAIMGMVATPYLRMRLAPVVFRMFYDAGRLEVAGDNPGEAVGRIRDFPATEVLCERFCGIWEGLAEPGPIRALEAKCVRRGDPYCEYQLVPAGG